MDINSLRGISAYANTPTPPVDQNQNVEASKADLAKENTNAAQNAFEVTITEEAREKSTLEAKQETNKTQSAPPVDQGAQNEAKEYEASRIVNIIA